ncbi:TIGR00282 family metallophosphoesterase [Alicyclobacillus tolerans]|uniref:TIGR00282 family metallophosphoesterase n=1 Tax=Alicyclobacillus tolerans TaxID=90970 RepID=UPI001F0239E9|nr:TIGR00282 family metallophosphoesterase [Alicyclobacillus tolerans]MCF8564831.1 TIGR00282 family metallophosphoesterase [Alicyclobacillus tolerans]
MRILFLGDIVGRPGLDYAETVLKEILSEEQPDLVVANAENSAGGRGLNRRSAEALYDAGVEILTLGNHSWDQRELISFIDEDERIVRPANYPPGTPGRGYTVCRVQNTPVLIINVMGRTFLSQLDCPFRTVEGILREHPDIRHVLVDIHAETTSEKLAMGWHFAGRVSAVLGTHTHVPTADERVLPGGTAYITDVGMVGPYDGILGMDRHAVIRRQLTQMPVKFEVAEGARQFCAVAMTWDEQGKASEIRRIYRTEV